MKCSEYFSSRLENFVLTIDKSQVNLNKTLKTLSFEDVSLRLHPEVHIEIKLNIARSIEEAKEQSKSGKAIINTEITGGDIRSDRAQKDAKRFEIKNNTKEFEKKDQKLAVTGENDVKKNKKENMTEIKKIKR